MSSRVTPADAIASLRRVDEQVVGGAVPVLAERRAAHPDDRDPVADACDPISRPLGVGRADATGRAFQK